MSSSPPSPRPHPTPSPPAEWADDVERARSGDRAAFARLYHRFAPVVHAVLLGLVDRAEADDLTQETFVRVLQSLPALHDHGAFPAWVLTIARNLAADRARARRPALALTEDTQAPGPAPEPSAPGPSAAERALAAIRTLPEAYRETLLMRLVEGLSGPMIAERTGLTEGSVRVNLSRGMALLRAKLAGKAGEP